MYCLLSETAVTCCLPSVCCNEDVLIEAGPRLQAGVWLNWLLFKDLRYSNWHAVKHELRLCQSAWLEVGRSRPSICLQHNSKMNDPKVLGYTRCHMLLGLKGQGHRVNESILHTITVIHRHSLGGVTSRLQLRGCLLRASLTLGRWRNQSSAWIKLYECLLVFHWFIQIRWSLIS